MNLTFVSNSSNGSAQCINVTIIDDTLVEGSKKFTVILTEATVGVGIHLERDTSTTITIEDNEGNFKHAGGILIEAAFIKSPKQWV